MPPKRDGLKKNTTSGIRSDLFDGKELGGFLADQGRWFKLWVTALTDPDLRELSLENFGRWCIFGAYLKAHGNEGMLCLSAPATSVQETLRLPDFNAVVSCLKMFPNCVVNVKQCCDDEVPSQLIVTWQNWHKYQVDSSAERMRKKRSFVTTKKRREEKRRDETRRENKRTVFVRPTFLELDEFIKSEKLNIEAQRFLNHYEANGWRVGKNPMKDWKATARNWKPQGEFHATASKPANAFVATGAESSKYDRK